MWKEHTKFLMKQKMLKAFLFLLFFFFSCSPTDVAPLSFLPWACRLEEIVPYEHCSLPLPAGKGNTDYNRDWAKMCNLSQQNSLLFVPLQLGSCSKRDVIFQVTFNQSLVHKKTPELTARLFFLLASAKILIYWAWNKPFCHIFRGLKCLDSLYM